MEKNKLWVLHDIKSDRYSHDVVIYLVTDDFELLEIAQSQFPSATTSLMYKNKIEMNYGASIVSETSSY